MEPVAFDSLRYSRRLAEVGVPRQQAELQAEVMAEAFGYYTREIVTREYLQTTLRAEFAEQNARLERSILGKVDERFAQLDKPFGIMNSRFEGIDSCLEQVDQHFQQIDRRFDQVDQRFEQVDQRLREIDRRFDQVDQRFEQVDQRFEQVEKRLGAVESDLKALTAKVHRMDKTLHLHSWILGVNTLGVMSPFLRDIAGYLAAA